MKKSNSQFHPIRDGVIATVVGGVILALIAPPFRDFVVRAASAVVRVIAWVWRTLSTSHPIPGWVITLGVLFILAGAFIILAALREVLLEDDPRRRYTEDYIDGAKWRWIWTSKGITGLCGYCPTCDAELVAIIESSFQSSTDFICDRCSSPRDGSQFRVVTKLMGSRVNALASIKREIRRRVRTGQYDQRD